MLLALFAGGLVAVGRPDVAPAQGSQQHRYIGAKRCGSCHSFAYERWKSGPHARAHQSLTAEQLADPKCNTCHAMVPEENAERFAGVQCESCHGPGKYYHPSYVMKDHELSRALGLAEPTAETCTQCHSQGVPTIQGFDFERMWSRIAHGERARAAARESNTQRVDAE